LEVEVVPTEVTTEGLEKVSGMYRAASAKKQIKVNVADSVSMRQDLPRRFKSTSSFNDGQDNNTSSETIQTKVNDLNTQVQNSQRDLQFSVDTDSGRTIIRVINSETRETIRIIPTDDISVIAQRLKRHTGVLFNARV
jgi:flagellar protein FlaG